MKDNPLFSFSRHWITGAIFTGAGRLGLTGDSLPAVVSYLAELVVLFFAWLVVKYVIPWVAKSGFLDFLKKNSDKLPLVLFCCVIVVLSLGMTSCGVGNPQVSGFYRHESGAKAGLDDDDEPFLVFPIDGEHGTGFIEIQGGE